MSSGLLKMYLQPPRVDVPQNQTNQVSSALNPESALARNIVLNGPHESSGFFYFLKFF